MTIPHYFNARELVLNAIGSGSASNERLEVQHEHPKIDPKEGFIKEWQTLAKRNKNTK